MITKLEKDQEEKPLDGKQSTNVEDSIRTLQNHDIEQQNIGDISQILSNQSGSAQKIRKITPEQHLSYIDMPVQLFVFEMNQTTTQEQLKQHFLQAGNVLQVFLPLSNGQNRKFGFVSMKDKQQAEIAVNVLNESILELLVSD
ncbi:MAG: hypothetical protein EZS28_021530 [Streblomastix strix]|uniref:RRM domain-containing protein n=1 Tax=Streblomastix strix TaxID=222440 RepID=A0A5J4VK36_9EUKA|nr:MAG: hypothetical protein EZS28_021530 [Streblomastix strix]